MISLSLRRFFAAAFLTIATGTVAAQASVQTLGLYMAVGQPVTIEELDAILNARYAPTPDPPEDIAYGSFVYLAEFNWSFFPQVQSIVYSAPSGTAAPEPSTWMMLLAGFGGLGLVAYRRRQGQMVVTSV